MQNTGVQIQVPGKQIFDVFIPNVGLGAVTTFAPRKFDLACKTINRDYHHRYGTSAATDEFYIAVGSSEVLSLSTAQILSVQFHLAHYSASFYLVELLQMAPGKWISRTQISAPISDALGRVGTRTWTPFTQGITSPAVPPPAPPPAVRKIGKGIVAWGSTPPTGCECGGHTAGLKKGQEGHSDWCPARSQRLTDIVTKRAALLK